MWEQPKLVITNHENFIGHKDSHQHTVNMSMLGQTDDTVGSCDSEHPPHQSVTRGGTLGSETGQMPQQQHAQWHPLEWTPYLS